MGVHAGGINDDALSRVLWMTRALPVALDVLADNRASPGLASARLSSVEVHARPCRAGPLIALGVLMSESRELHVRFVCAQDAGVESVALVRWRLSAKVAGDDGPPVIHRFVHGPRR